MKAVWYSHLSILSPILICEGVDAILFCKGFEYPFLVRYGITLALQLVLMGQSRIKGDNEVLGGLS